MAGAPADTGRDPRALVGQVAGRLREAAGTQAQAEAEWLVAGTLGLRRTELYLRQAPLTVAEAAQVWTRLDRRLSGEPLARVLGAAEFLGHALRISPDAFIPRPETEALTLEAIAWLRRRGGELTVLDVCAGSGAIAIAVAVAVASCRVIALELLWEVISLARENVRASGLDGRIRLVQSDLATGVRGFVDVLISNPPYVPTGELERMGARGPGDPRPSLDGGADGLVYVRRLLDDAARLLRPGGMACLECAEDQAASIAGTARALAWVETVRILKDLAGRPRGVLLERRMMPGPSGAGHQW